MTTRRNFIDSLGQLGMAGTLGPLATACSTLRSPPPPPSAHHDLVVIGTGFGGSMTALSVAYAMEERLGRRPPSGPLSILMLERGTWWTTPVETVQDKQVKTRDFLIGKGQPTQEWSSLSDSRGMLDLLRRCRLSDARPQGLYDFVAIGKRGLFGLTNDGVSVLRASGVGGGSLVYSKILVRPPETLFDDARWPGDWRGPKGASERNRRYADALKAVTHGVSTLRPGHGEDETGLTGPSQILTRVAGLKPAATEARPPAVALADARRGTLRIRISPDAKTLAPDERELIDRARVFQTAISQLTDNYGTLDLSINDMAFAGAKPGLKKPGVNVCERHGRCNVGCLPGAGQTLNKQLMRAIYGRVDTGTIDGTPAADAACPFRNVTLQLEALAVVSHVSQRPEGGYLVHYRQLSAHDPAGVSQEVVVSADRVILAAGCLGTTELLLRSGQHAGNAQAPGEGLPGLSDRLGHGFSPNGDHIAFLSETKERINLNYGPVTTSFGQFKADSPMAAGFHNVEDQGVPRAFSALTGYGAPLIQRLASNHGLDSYVEALGGALTVVNRIFDRTPQRRAPAASAADMSASRPESEDELTARVMCVVAQGKDDANGRLTLQDERLRLKREDNLRFHQDRIYTEIHETLGKLAMKLRPDGSDARFVSPLFDKLLPGMEPTVLTSHPLGGCPMGESVETGVVDEHGRVYCKAPGRPPVFPGLYVADGSMIPTALGVNPALTISAVALRVADKVLAEWEQIPTHRGARAGGGDAPACIPQGLRT